MIRGFLGLLLIVNAVAALAQRKSDAAETARPASVRDGQHDFDWEFGNWHTHLWRLKQSLSGSNEWVDYDGTTVVRKIWDGRANMVELEVNGPTHIEALNLRLYNPETHKWSLNFASSKGGTLGTPTDGEFKNGRGEFYDEEDFNGRPVLVRFIISDIKPESCEFEQSFSTDSGKTWEVNWIAIDTRVKEGLSSATKDAAKKYLEKFIADNNIAGVLIQVTTPAGSWSEALGKANRAPSTSTSMSMSMDLQHRIGSVTKTFTTTLILQLAQEGKLNLDDPVSKFVAGVPNGDKITLRMLGNMTSGLREYLANAEFRNAFFKNPNRTLKPRELLDASYKQGAAFAPGTNSDYSNANTVLLGLVVEKVEGKPFAEVLKEKILVPQGLSHTFFPIDEKFSGPHIHGYTSLYPGKEDVDSTSWSPSQAYAAGAMISTVADLTKWARLVGTGALISPELRTERLKWDRLGDNDDNWHYTFGLEENSGWLGHNGMIPGYFTFVVYNPRLEATIVIAMNTDKKVNGEQGINVLLRDISKILFPDNPVNVPVIK